MTWMSLGSLALPHQLQRHGLGLRNDLARLALEMTTGESATPAARLKGDLQPLAALEARAQRIGSLREVTQQAMTNATVAQTALARVAQSSGETSARMLAVSTAGIDQAALTAAGQAARAVFADITGALGADVAGHALFSGSASDRSPLAAPDSMLSALSAAVAGATSADEVATIVTAAFMDPGGLFETSFYQGGPAVDGAILESGQAVPALPTAADPALRRSLAGLATAALVADDSLTLSGGQRQALARTAALTLSGAEASVTALQSDLGQVEGRLETALTRLTGERDALVLSREALIGVDPYEAATRLEMTQTRLELIYTVTARTSRLSLAGYL